MPGVPFVVPLPITFQLIVAVCGLPVAAPYVVASVPVNVTVFTHGPKKVAPAVIVPVTLEELPAARALPVLGLMLTIPGNAEDQFSGSEPELALLVTPPASGRLPPPRTVDPPERPNVALIAAVPGGVTVPVEVNTKFSPAPLRL